MPKISEAQAEDAKKIASIDANALGAILRAIREKANLFELEELDTIFSETCGEDAGDALFRLAASISYRIDGNETSTKEILSSIKTALETDAQSRDEAKSFEALSSTLENIFSEPSLYCSFKAARITSTIDRHIHQLKIVVGTRPIFLLNREEVFANVIHANMSLVTSDASETESHLTFKLTLKQIDRLIDECNLAKKKIEALRSLLTQKGVGAISMEQ